MSMYDEMVLHVSMQVVLFFNFKTSDMLLTHTQCKTLNAGEVEI